MLKSPFCPSRYSEQRVLLGSIYGVLSVYNKGKRLIKESSLPTTHIVNALEGVSWSTTDYFGASATQVIVGNWNREIGAGRKLSSLLSIGASNDDSLKNLYMSFPISYTNTGL